MWQIQNERSRVTTHPHDAVDKHHPFSIHSFLYELGHKREVLANVRLRSVQQLQAQELYVQSLLQLLSLDFNFEWFT